MHSKSAKAVALSMARYLVTESLRLKVVAPAEGASLSAAASCICAAYQLDRAELVAAGESNAADELRELKRACDLPPETPAEAEERSREAERHKAAGAFGGEGGGEDACYACVLEESACRRREERGREEGK